MYFMYFKNLKSLCQVHSLDTIKSIVEYDRYVLSEQSQMKINKEWISYKKETNSCKMFRCF